MTPAPLPEVRGGRVALVGWCLFAAGVAGAASYASPWLLVAGATGLVVAAAARVRLSVSAPLAAVVVALVAWVVWWSPSLVVAAGLSVAGLVLLWIAQPPGERGAAALVAATWATPMRWLAPGDARGPLGVASWVVRVARVVEVPLAEPDAAERLAAWAAEQPPGRWRGATLGPAADQALARLRDDARLVETLRDAFGPDVELHPAPALDTVLVGVGASAQVDHVDVVGPPWPFAQVVRTVVPLGDAHGVATVFPMIGSESDEAAFATEAAVGLAFDLHREPHRVVGDDDAGAYALVHHVATPPGATGWGQAVAAWAARADAGPTPPSVGRRAMAWVEAQAGWDALAYVAVCALAGWAFASPTLFLVTTSFVHYLVYIGTYAATGPVAYRRFRRDAVFFKAVSTAQLVYWYVVLFDPLPIAAVSLLCVLTGFGLSGLSTRRLGLERTYFGVELGHVPPERIEGFPYGVVPHPMIVGSALAMIGFHLMPSFRAAWPWLIPAHLAFYALHLTQEIVGTRARMRDETASA